MGSDKAGLRGNPLRALSPWEVGHRAAGWAPAEGWVGSVVGGVEALLAGGCGAAGVEPLDVQAASVRLKPASTILRHSIPQVSPSVDNGDMAEKSAGKRARELNEKIR